MKKLLAIILTLFIFTTISHGQFQSVKDGTWNDPLTWSTDPNATALPDSNSSVTISHRVTARSQFNINYYPHCYDLTIDVNGVLTNYESAYTSGDIHVHNDFFNYGTFSPNYAMGLTIKGNFYNYGEFSRTASRGYLNIFSYGNIINYGSFRVGAGSTSSYYYGIRFKGDNPHHLQTYNDSTIYISGIIIEDSEGYIIVDSLASLSAYINLNKSKIVLPSEITYPNTLELVGGQIVGGEIIANENTIRTKSVNTLGDIRGDANNLKIKDANLDGYYRTGGTHYGETSRVIFEGENILIGVIENIYSTSTLYSDMRGVYIEGNFTNNGSMQNNIGDELYINVLSGNFINNGKIDASGMKFYGDCEFSSLDSVALGAFGAVDSNTTVTISSGDIIFKDRTVDVNFNGGKLILPSNGGFYTDFMWYNKLRNIYVEANNSEISFSHVEDNTIINNPNIRYLTNSTNSTLSGDVEINKDGTLIAYSNSYPHVTIEGNINNYGSIRNHYSSGSLYLEITGNIHHDGRSWENLETKLNGSDDQNILIPNDSSWTGKVVLDAMLTGTTYQWQKDGVDISVANSQTYTFNSGLSAPSYGEYVCVVDGNLSRKIFVGNQLPNAFEITDVVIKNIDSTTTMVLWKSTVPAAGFIFYVESDASSGYPLEAEETSGLVTEHTLLLENLTFGSTYYFIIDQNDEGWINNVRSEEFSFVAGDFTLGALAINSIVDVPEDQGGWVYVNFDADIMDATGDIKLYGVYEWMEEEWVSLGSVPATQDSVYTFLAHTYKDSTNMGIYWSKFYISAHSTDPLVYFNSQPDSGYSIDNLAPQAPEGLAVISQVNEYSVELRWNRNSEKDINYYCVYKEDEKIATIIDTTFIDSDVLDGEYVYKITAVDFNGNESGFSESVSAVVGVEDETELPTEFSLSQNYPNPFNPSTVIEFALPTSGNVSLKVFNSLGEEVAELVNTEMVAGYHSVNFDASNLSSGIYFYRITADNFIQAKKMLLLR
ncbi:MAG: T9SS type A sorting domain-containing protein [Melioribacteraceae bacterium]|jgi:uncharacterized protein YegJ (DUF2314 family)|nr:T9SS type A sorting domain-containing protein [Melioribacteraceae bacterium]